PGSPRSARVAAHARRDGSLRRRPIGPGLAPDDQTPANLPAVRETLDAPLAKNSGFEHDYDREGAFHYRDFVIRALNADMPYDQFVRWQLAGDEFDPENPLALTATGFLGAGVFPTQITANEVERTRYDAMDDMLATTGTAM